MFTFGIPRKGRYTGYRPPPGPSARKIIETRLDQIRRTTDNPMVHDALDEIEVICSAYMETEVMGLGHRLGLSRSSAKMFELLLARRGQVVTREALLNACYHHADSNPMPKIIDVHICHIRKRVPKEYQIENVHGVGFRMLPESNQQLKAA